MNGVLGKHGHERTEDGNERQKEKYVESQKLIVNR